MHNQLSHKDCNHCYYFYYSLLDNCAHSVTKYFFLYAVVCLVCCRARRQLSPLPSPRPSVRHCPKA